MALFGRGKQDTRPNDELANLRRSVQNRGQAKIPEATTYVASYLGKVARSAGVAGNPVAEAWLRDRFRMFLVVGLANWFDVLDRIPEGAALRDEWRSLCFDAHQFGPEHLVAWWWLTSEPLFRPLMENQLGVMSSPLADGASDIQRSGGNFEQQMVDWTHFFD